MADEELIHQRQVAMRALLAKPLLTTAADPEKLPLVRKHAEWLTEWLARETGWRLYADNETARLFKTAPTLTDGTHPARDRSGAAFGRRRYVILCLALAVLERADSQTTLGALAEEVLNSSADPALMAAGFVFTLETRSERSDLVAVVRMLVDWGVVAKVAGDEDAYLSASGDVLYDIRRPVLASLLTGTRGPSTVTESAWESRLESLLSTPVPDTDDLRNQAFRRDLTRRLLDDPVVYYSDLSESALAYLISQRHAIARRITEATGLVPEIRAEGIAMVDPLDELTDVRMPEQRTDGHVTLLVAEYLADHGSVEKPELIAFVAQVAEQHKSYWRKGVTEPGAATQLLDIALEKLVALHLVSVDGSQIASLPAIGRYAIDEPTLKIASTS